ncbi:hypothetical protein [Ethanoligenens sp.]|uniref:hypothetical protein n=1 Tax=Ethanoligenens sp. TaxID=2099655 RepID=UPI0039EA3C22
MIRKHFYLSQEALDALEKLSNAAHLNTSQFLNKALLDMAAKLEGAEKHKSAADEAHRAYLAAHAAAKLCAEFCDMFNSYLHSFESSTTADQFRTFDRQPHIWAQKAQDAEEQRIHEAYSYREYHKKKSLPSK